MGAQSLTLFTFNTRGLRDFIKRNNLFFWLKEKQMIKKNVRAGLEKQISETEEKIIATNYNSNKLIEKRDISTQELHDMIQQQNKGAQIRSRAKWIEEGE